MSSLYLHILSVYHCDGGTYVSICQYMYVFSLKYMHIHQAGYEHISNTLSDSIFVCVSKFQQNFLLYFSCTYTTVTVPSRLPHVRRRRSSVSATFAMRPLRQVCRTAAQAKADRHIQSDQVCATERRHPAASYIGAPWLRAEVPWQSCLAVDHKVTADSLSGAATSK
jgi:hypothetical protein